MYDVMIRSSFASEVEQKTRFQYSAPGSDFCFIFLPNSSFSSKWLCGVEHIAQHEYQKRTYSLQSRGNVLALKYSSKSQFMSSKHTELSKNIVQEHWLIKFRLPNSLEFHIFFTVSNC